MRQFIDPMRGASSSQLPRFFRWFSEHCVLRQLEASDAESIWSSAVHPAFAQCFSSNSPSSREEVDQMIRNSQLDWQRASRYTLGVQRKGTQEFVGWVELRAAEAKGTWLVNWFVHPRLVVDEIAHEMVSAAADLMFSTLNATALYANCPSQHPHFETLLNDVGFIELVPAGSLDPRTQRPRRQSLYELRQRDWQSIQRARTNAADASAATTPWSNSSVKLELQLL